MPTQCARVADAHIKEKKEHLNFTQVKFGLKLRAKVSK